MNKRLEAIIKKTTFKILKGRFVYTKVAKPPNIDKHFFISKDEDEITVLTREKNLKGLDMIEKNKDFYRLISLNVSLPFYATGFLAAISSAVVKQGSGALIISTYSKDYIVVREENLQKAKRALLSLGLSQAD